MSLEMPKSRLFQITCVIADGQNRPQRIASGGTFRRDNQSLCTSPQTFDSVFDALRSDERHFFLVDEDPNQPLKTLYMYTVNDINAEAIRVLLDRHFEIETATCIMIEQFVPMGPKIFIG
jgi:hypothetical protein